MDIDRCNSVFELFSAFNFTYAVLSHPDNVSKVVQSENNGNKSFADIVDSYLIRPFDRLNNLIAPTELRVTKLKESLLTIKKSFNDPSILGQCELLLHQTTDVSLLINIWRDGVDESKSNAKVKVNQKFPFASFLLALFCISVLILSASESTHKHLTLFFLDLLLGLEVLWYFFWPRKRKRDLTYRDILYTYILGLVTITIIHFILKFHIKNHNLDLYSFCTRIVDTNEFRRPLFILINIILPFSHFIYYYFVFQNELTRKDKEASQQIPLIEKALLHIENGHEALEKST
ncbi:hypothetical protein [Fibrella forsythiae]|uniref:Uncharacterized protein n=1 Tax=Fibrella forsythiae TaxID=2817061 RepID=A0ABS3JKS7_9BACT|nr:hypothetical protein [Fibrella forsythiae]MBO0950600.1 hypothetical protein [Fibrella forsythiae]